MGDVEQSTQAHASGEPGCPGAEQLALLHQWNDLHTGFRRITQRLMDEVEAGSGLDAASFQVLWYLTTAPDQTAPMNQLSACLMFTTAGTTKVVDRLCRSGLLERRPHPTDRRVILTALTPAGRHKATDACRVLADALRDKIVAPLGPDRFAATVDTLTSLAAQPLRARG